MFYVHSMFNNIFHIFFFWKCVGSIHTNTYDKHQILIILKCFSDLKFSIYVINYLRSLPLFNFSIQYKILIF